MVNDVDIHALGRRGLAFGAIFIASDVSTFGIETLIKSEADSFSPSIMELIINENLELYITIVGQVDKL